METTIISRKDIQLKDLGIIPNLTDYQVSCILRELENRFPNGNGNKELAKEKLYIELYGKALFEEINKN